MLKTERLEGEKKRVGWQLFTRKLSAGKLDPGHAGHALAPVPANRGRLKAWYPWRSWRDW